MSIVWFMALVTTILFGLGKVTVNPQMTWWGVFAPIWLTFALDISLLLYYRKMER